MSATTITLGNMLSFDLTTIFAEEIHAELIRRHLKRIGYAEPHWVSRGNFAEVCRAIRSIDNTGYYSPRREFVIGLKCAFRHLRTKKHTEPRWQTYVQSVAAVHGMHAPTDVNDPAWETFVLKQPRECSAAA